MNPLFVFFILAVVIQIPLLLDAQEDESLEDVSKKPSSSMERYLGMDRSKWVDPDAMFDYVTPNERPAVAATEKCPAYVPIIPETCRPTELQVCHQRAYHFTLRLSKRLSHQLSELGADSERISTYIENVSEVLKDLQKDEQNNSCGLIDDVEKHLFAIIDSMTVHRSMGYMLNFERNALMLAVTLFLTILLLMMYCCVTLSHKAKMAYLLVYFTLGATCWTWCHMYQEKLAENRLVIEQLAKDCLEDPKNAYTTMEWIMDKATLGIVFKRGSEKDKCAKYYSSVMTEPALSINPATALSRTLSLLFFTPMEIFGQKFGKGAVEFFGQLPTVFVPVFLFAGVVVIVYAMKFTAEYAIRSKSSVSEVKKYYITRDNTNQLEAPPRRRLERANSTSSRARQIRSRSLLDLRAL